MAAASTVIFASSGNKNLNALLLCPTRKLTKSSSEEKEVRLQIGRVSRMGKGEDSFQNFGGTGAAA